MKNMEVMKKELIVPGKKLKYRYSISTNGVVYNEDKCRIIKQSPTFAGYIKVTLATESGKRTTEYVHRLMALAFIANNPDPNRYNTVNHINQNRQDNRIENLEWCTMAENNKKRDNTAVPEEYRQKNKEFYNKNREYFVEYQRKLRAARKLAAI